MLLSPRSMVRDAALCAAPHHEVCGAPRRDAYLGLLILRTAQRARLEGCCSVREAWFETRRRAPLLTMRFVGAPCREAYLGLLILRSARRARLEGSNAQIIPQHE